MSTSALSSDVKHRVLIDTASLNANVRNGSKADNHLGAEQTAAFVAQQPEASGRLTAINGSRPYAREQTIARPAAQRPDGIWGRASLRPRLVANWHSGLGTQSALLTLDLNR